MAAPSRASIEALIEGDVSGQVAVGDNIVQISNVHGGVVNVGAVRAPPVVRRRAADELHAAKPASALVGRGPELEAVLSALRAGQTVEVHGPPGVGKTTLVKHATSRPEVPAGGVVYRRARRQTLDDVLQALFEAFYEFDAGMPVKPVGGQLRAYLAAVAAVVVLDDLELDREDLQELIGIAPSCRFVVAAERACLFGEGLTFALAGLAEAEALAFVADQLGHPLEGDELQAAQQLWQRVDGRPLGLIQAAGRAREERRSLVDVLAEPGSGGGGLNEAEQRVLTALAAVDGAALERGRVASLAGLGDATEVLASLQRRGLVQSHSPSYSLTTPAVATKADVAAVLDDFRRVGGTELDAALALLEVASRHGLWDGVLRLASATDTAMALSGRWGTWERALTLSGQAAAAIGDRPAEGRAQHQLGVRALCLGDTGAARNHLAGAVRIRRAVGDDDGATISQYHLDLLGGSPPGDGRDERPSDGGPEPARRGRGRGRFLAGAAAVAVLVAGGVTALAVKPWETTTSTTVTGPVVTGPTPSSTTTTARTTSTTIAGISGVYRGAVTVIGDPGKHEDVVPARTWTVLQPRGSTDVELSDIFVRLVLKGSIEAPGKSFVASGTGVVASRPGVFVSFSGTVTARDGVKGTLTVGGNKTLADGQTISFSVDLRKV